MLKDPSRGWAWTRALLGVAAEEVHDPAQIVVPVLDWYSADICDEVAALVKLNVGSPALCKGGGGGVRDGLGACLRRVGPQGALREVHDSSRRTAAGSSSAGPPASPSWRSRTFSVAIWQPGASCVTSAMPMATCAAGAPYRWQGPTT